MEVSPTSLILTPKSSGQQNRSEKLYFLKVLSFWWPLAKNKNTQKKTHKNKITQKTHKIKWPAESIRKTLFP